MKIALIETPVARRHNGLFRAAALLFASVLSFGLPDDAQAQFICPNGPGPGEFLVNQIQGHPEEPPLYLCMGSGDTGSSVAPPRPPIEIQPSYLAVARGEDGSIWVSVGHRTVESAKKRVLNACAAAQRRECYVSDTLFDEGFVFVAEDAMGQLWTKTKPLDRKTRTGSANSTGTSLSNIATKILSAADLRAVSKMA